MLKGLTNSRSETLKCVMLEKPGVPVGTGTHLGVVLVRVRAVRPAVEVPAAFKCETFCVHGLARQIAVRSLWKLVFVIKHLGIHRASILVRRAG